MNSDLQLLQGVVSRPAVRSESPPRESPARRLAAILTAGRVPADLYSTAGARLYERLAELDDSEQRELLRCLRDTDGDILELACGGGRLTLPLLSLGRPVVGLDLSAEMIRILRDRYGRLRGAHRRPLESVVGDMRDFDLGRRFGAIVLATTSILLLDASGRRQLFDSVRRHLACEGVFFVTAHVLPARPGASSARVVPLGDGNAEVALLCDQIDGAGSTREVTAAHLARDREGRLDVSVFSSTVFTASADDLDAELVAAGFHRVESIEVETVSDTRGLRIGGYSV